MPEYADKYDEETYEQLYEDDELSDAIYALCDEYEYAPNDGSIEKTDVEVLAKKLFPMFNFDGLMKLIHSDFLVFDSYEMSVQISDGWGNDFYCSACAWFDADLAPGRWQNF